jgi:hypothetical protein
LKTTHSTKILEKYQRAITKEIVEEEVVSLEKKMGRPKKKVTG